MRIARTGGDRSSRRYARGVLERWIRLNGRDFSLLGPLACAALPDAGAIALSRGLHPKGYDHEDPNEDGALVYLGGERRLLAVVDGHHGVLASEIALDGVLAQAPALLGMQGETFRSATERLVREVAGRIPERSRSRTCLALLVLEPGRCEWACFGDAAVLRSGDLLPQSVPNDLFLGPELRVRVLPPELWCGAFVPAPRERVALLSDGVVNFHPARERLPEALAAPADDLAIARALAGDAMRAGAGDNVATAIATA
jgi:hypothetical protein